MLEAPKHRPDDLTGVPGMTSWSRVYLFVGGCFLLWLTLLTLLTLSYS